MDQWMSTVVYYEPSTDHKCSSEYASEYLDNLEVIVRIVMRSTKTSEKESGDILYVPVQPHDPNECPRQKGTISCAHLHIV